MKEVAKDAFENNLHHYEAMKKLLRGQLSKRECSVQEAVYHILPKLKLRRVFPVVCFGNKNVPQEPAQVLLSGKKLNELPDDSANTFRKSNIDWYIDRRNVLLSGEKCSALDDYCYAEFSAYYTMDNKPNHSCEYQTHGFQNKLIEENLQECG